jgi:hypothetical protein
MRLLAPVLFFLGLITALPVMGAAEEGSPVEFVRIWPSWRDRASFVRISEYFGGEENTGRQTMLRTQPEKRTGYYFLTRTRNPDASRTDVKFVLDIITPDSPVAKTYTFPAHLPAGGHVFNLGLTGKDWAGKGVQPVAWRLRLLDAGGLELARGESFLWRMPDHAAR